MCLSTAAPVANPGSPSQGGQDQGDPSEPHFGGVDQFSVLLGITEVSDLPSKPLLLNLLSAYP